MWILSQNKLNLMEVKDIYVSNNRVKTFTGCYQEGEAVVLGIYDTQKRATEVLRKIQLRLMEGTIVDDLVRGKRTTKHVVFEMPVK